MHLCKDIGLVHMADHGNHLGFADPGATNRPGHVNLTPWPPWPVSCFTACCTGALNHQFPTKLV